MQYFSFKFYTPDDHHLQDKKKAQQKQQNFL